MCGIAAIFSYNGPSEVDREELRTMRDHMSARGPDGFGEWFSEEGSIGFGHRRLSIIDLSDRAAQPMSTPDGRYTITFNGEIYNYKELRRRLQDEGQQLQSDSDTEVILQLFARKGIECVHDLRGMFAFALWDNVSAELFLARDPYGIKPLYYSDDGVYVRAASQVKAILAGGKVSHAHDPAGLVGFYLLGSVPEPFTIYSAVRAVPAGSWVRIDRSGVQEPVRYFNIAEVFARASEQAFAMNESHAMDFIREALKDSVAHHMIADVPVGAFLSAGIDSGTLCGLIRDAGIEDLQTMTLAFDEYRGKHDDEAPLAEEVAAYYRTRHHTRRLGIEEFNHHLGRIFDAMDQPSIDGVNTYFVSLVAAEAGLKVALSGLGGDELFGGYNSFDDIPQWVRRFSVPSRIPFLGDLFRVAYSTILDGKTSRSAKAAGILKYGGTFPGAWYLRRGLFMPWELDEFLDRDLVRHGLESLQLIGHLQKALYPDPRSPFARVAALEASLYMRNQLLRDTDWAGMAHSIELRVPLVDVDLLRTLAPALLRYASKHRKQLLASSPTRPLPEHIRTRAKTGFQVPVHSWLEQNSSVDAWRGVPSLQREGTPWARRWAYSVMETAFKISHARAA